MRCRAGGRPVPALLLRQFMLVMLLLLRLPLLWLSLPLLLLLLLQRSKGQGEEQCRRGQQQPHQLPILGEMLQALVLVELAEEVVAMAARSSMPTLTLPILRPEERRTPSHRLPS